jgi:RNA-directed DNA polymerase
VDDLLLMDLPRAAAFEARDRVAEFLRSKLRLSLSKATIAPTRRGVNFVGFRTWGSRRFVRRRALHIFRQAVKRSDLQAVVSSLGHARKTASHRHMTQHLQEHWYAIHSCLPQGHRRLHDVQRQAA